MKIYSSKYLSVDFDDQYKLIKMAWLSGTDTLDPELYKSELIHYLKAIEKYKPQLNLSDMRKMRFTICPSLQEWTNEMFLSVVVEKNLVAKRVAIILPDDQIDQLSIEQTMEEDAGTKFHTKYFKEEQDALHWVLN